MRMGAAADYRCSLPSPKGCFKQLLYDIRTNAVTVGGVAAGIGGLEVRRGAWGRISPTLVQGCLTHL